MIYPVPFSQPPSQTLTCCAPSIKKRPWHSASHMNLAMEVLRLHRTRAAKSVLQGMCVGSFSIEAKSAEGHCHRSACEALVVSKAKLTSRILQFKGKPRKDHSSIVSLRRHQHFAVFLLHLANQDPKTTIPRQIRQSILVHNHVEQRVETYRPRVQLHRESRLAM